MLLQLKGVKSQNQYRLENDQKKRQQITAVFA